MICDMLYACTIVIIIHCIVLHTVLYFYTKHFIAKILFHLSSTGNYFISISIDYIATERQTREAKVLRRESRTKKWVARERQPRLCPMVHRQQCRPHCHQSTAAQWSLLHHASPRPNVLYRTSSPACHRRGSLFCVYVYCVRCVHCYP